MFDHISKHHEVLQIYSISLDTSRCLEMWPNPIFRVWYTARIPQVTDRMEELKRQYDEKSAQKEELRKKAEITELKLERAGKLVSGLAGERDRWEASVKVRKLKISYYI